MSRALLLLALTALPGCGAGAWIERRDPRFDALVPFDARLEKLADGFTWIEGPLWIEAREELLFSDIPANRVWAWREGEQPRVFLESSGYSGSTHFTGREPGSNGLALDPSGALVLCEHGDRRVTRLEQDGAKTVLASAYRGRRLNSPNDAVFDSLGNLYFTDPPFGLPETFDDPGKELSFSGVFRRSPMGALTLVLDELEGPNGIALSPDEATLYVSNARPDRPVWLAYDLSRDGVATNGRVFCDASPWTRTKRGFPDGMKVDRAGNLFAAGPEGIYVFASDGAHLGTLHLGAPTSNCAFDGEGSTLFITAGTALWRLRVTPQGAGTP